MVAASGGAPVRAGTAVEYALTLTNNDEGCAPGSFAFFVAAAPPGFAVAPTLDLLPPLPAGQSRTVRLTVTSPAEAEAGDGAVSFAFLTEDTQELAVGQVPYVVAAPSSWQRAPRRELVVATDPVPGAN
jgi:hypothetical protein